MRRLPVPGVLRMMVRRDLLLAMRRRAEVANVLLFFVIVASLFPLGVGPEANLLRSIAPGVIWVAALLASLLGLGRMFAADHADGTLEQMLLARTPLGVIVVAKVAAHWLVTGLPLVLLAPVLALQFDLPVDALLVLVASLLLGTPSLTLVGAIGAALTLGVRGASVLTALLVLPLYVPVLILGTTAADAAAGGVGAQAHLLLLSAFLVLAGAFAPLAISAALRISAE
jgi:heme exporter protein B